MSGTKVGGAGRTGMMITINFFLSLFFSFFSPLMFLILFPRAMGLVFLLRPCFVALVLAG